MKKIDDKKILNNEGIYIHIYYDTGLNLHAKWIKSNAK